MNPTVIFDYQLYCSDNKYRSCKDFVIKSLRYDKEGKLDYVLLKAKDCDALAIIEKGNTVNNMMPLTVVFG